MWANNETGTLFPVAQLAQMARAVGALFHTDAVQAVGKIPIDLAATQIDMLSLSGHKLHGQKASAPLSAQGHAFRPAGARRPQERRRRGGTENVPGIVGLGAAAALALEKLPEEQGRVRALRDRLEQGVLQQAGPCRALGVPDGRLPNTTNIAFEHLEGEAVLHNLNKAGIAASLGSACASGSMEPSHVLKAMQVPASALRGAIRFSLSRDNTDDDVDRVLQVLRNHRQAAGHRAGLTGAPLSLRARDR